MKKMENGETVIGMLHHVIIGTPVSEPRVHSVLGWRRWGGIYRGDREISEETSEDVERPLTPGWRTLWWWHGDSVVVVTWLSGSGDGRVVVVMWWWGVTVVMWPWCDGGVATGDGDGSDVAIVCWLLCWWWWCCCRQCAGGSIVSKL